MLQKLLAALASEMVKMGFPIPCTANASLQQSNKTEKNTKHLLLAVFMVGELQSKKVRHTVVAACCMHISAHGNWTCALTCGQRQETFQGLQALHGHVLAVDASLGSLCSDAYAQRTCALLYALHWQGYDRLE